MLVIIIFRKNIFIVGEVKVPGSYPIIKDNETLLSILNRAGVYFKGS